MVRGPGRELQKAADTSFTNMHSTFQQFHWPEGHKRHICVFLNPRTVTPALLPPVMITEQLWERPLLDQDQLRAICSFTSEPHEVCHH